MFRGHGKFLLLVAIVVAGWTPVRGQGQASDAAKPSIAGGLAFTGELDSSLDSKKMKAGDPVIARAMEALKVQGTTILASGTKLVGHVVQAEARSKGDQESLLAIQFDKAVLKNKEVMPITLVIRAIAPAPHRPADDAGPGGDPMADRRVGVTTSPMASGRSAPPVAGGADAAGNAGDAGGALGADGKLTPTSRGVYGIKGMKLAVDSSKTPPVSVVISTEKNVHLDSGTRLLLFTEALQSTTPNP